MIVVKSDFDRFVEWQQVFAGHGLRAVRWDQMDQHRGEIDYALVWKPEPGSLASLANLKLVFSVGAGVDHLIGEDLVPAGIPVIRNVEAALTAGMVEHVVYQVIRFHRDMAAYDQDQLAGVWNPRMQTATWNHTVGIMGLGELGQSCGIALKSLGFNLCGWSHSSKSVPGIKSFAGDAELQDFLGISEFLVCLLPLTDATRGIINQRSLAALPRGAYLINAGRGPCVVDQDLLQALDSGQLSGAALDVFNQEPLPSDHPYWQHPGVTITPHVASITLPGTSAEHVIDNINRYRAGQPLTHLADLSRGY